MNPYAHDQQLRRDRRATSGCGISPRPLPPTVTPSAHTVLKIRGRSRGVAETSLPDLVKRSAVILLPLPATRDGETLLAPFAAEPIRLNDDFAAQFCNRTVYGGMIQKLTASSAIWKEIEPEDYYRREELAVGNAIATAEGAVAAAVREYPGTINGASCLVTGLGRIGKNLTLLLHAMGAHVFVAARKKSDLMFARALGAEPLTYREITRRFDIIFNTVPARVIGRARARPAGRGYADSGARLRAGRHRPGERRAAAGPRRRGAVAARPRRAENSGGIHQGSRLQYA